MIGITRAQARIIAMSTDVELAKGRAMNRRNEILDMHCRNVYHKVIGHPCVLGCCNCLRRA